MDELKELLSKFDEYDSKGSKNNEKITEVFNKNFTVERLVIKPTFDTEGAILKYKNMFINTITGAVSENGKIVDFLEYADMYSLNYYIQSEF